MNERLSGDTTSRDTLNRYTTEGEVWRLLGYIGAIAQNQQVPFSKLWEIDADESSFMPAYALG
eukprot:3686970-Prymnesium_polylepis.1